MDWTKKPLRPDFEKSDQPNQQSEHRCQAKQDKGNSENDGTGCSSNHALARFTSFLSLETLKLRLHLIDLLINHRFRSASLVVVRGIGSQLASLGELFTKGRNLLVILTELTRILQCLTTLLQILKLACITRLPGK